MSRSSVSRLLTYARDTGLVHVQIKAPEDGIAKLQHAIRVHEHVTPYIIPASPRWNPQELGAQVSRHAGRLLPSMVQSSMIVGVAWGTTMAAVARELTARHLADVTVVQLNGAASSSNFGLAFAGDILNSFADALGGRAEPLPVPTFFDDPATRLALWRERSIARVQALHERMDVAVFGVGDPRSTVPGHVYRSGYLDDEDYEAIARDGVVGDVATVFFRQDGTDVGIALNERSSGPPLDTLRKTPRRVCVVSDPSRLPALRGALAAGLITDLIIDEVTARELARTYVQRV